MRDSSGRVCWAVLLGIFAGPCAILFSSGYRELFHRFPATRRANGSEAIIAILNQQVETNQFAQVYIQSPGVIDRETLLDPYGPRVETKVPENLWWLVRARASSSAN